ncbi:MAG: sulfur carrier protein ThiS adenylyltransferase ThiF [Planctomycetes bacterium]|nr:sulfur carrier protein ThiS adenylyltransferase ThiF [Planctomycetota bacterium]
MGVNPYLSENERAVLESARVGVAGLGGLGSNVLCHLARAGARRFVAADFDVVAASNLNRQFYFADQVGMKKVEALAANLRRIDPELELDFRDLRLTAENLPGFFAGCDVVVEAFDQAEAKAMLIGAMAKTGVPVVAASGLAGFGESNAIRLRQVNDQLYIVGDLTRGVGAGLAPASPRVGIAAAMEANAVVAILLGIGV